MCSQPSVQTLNPLNKATYTLTFNVENRLTSVTVGSQTTTFAYDADRNRILTTHSPGPSETKVYTSFPDYEREVASGGAVTTRTTYRIAGQMAVVRLLLYRFFQSAWAIPPAAAASVANTISLTLAASASASAAVSSSGQNCRS